MKIAVVGSRAHPNLLEVRRFVFSLPLGTIIVSGGAAGVDHEAEVSAYLKGFAVEIFQANWKKHGKSAGLLRNHDIVAAADRVVVFWDGKSRGAMHTAAIAKAAGKPYEVRLCRRAPVNAERHLKLVP
jgi:predicted Rossmann fold nucleotide-binding protein DprA/Smf involved in DNA uptake